MLKTKTRYEYNYYQGREEYREIHVARDDQNDRIVVEQLITTIPSNRTSRKFLQLSRQLVRKLEGRVQIKQEI